MSPNATAFLHVSLSLFFHQELKKKPHSAIKVIVAKYLELGTIKPFSQLVNLGRFASSLVMSEPQPSRIAWDQNVSSVSIDVKRITLDGRAQ